MNEELGMMKSTIHLFSFREILCRCIDEIIHFSNRALGLRTRETIGMGWRATDLTTRSNKMCSSCSLSLGGNGNTMMGNKPVTVAFNNNKTPQFCRRLTRDLVQEPQRTVGFFPLGSWCSVSGRWEAFLLQV